ncbi:MAG: hypothetical protein MUE60_06225 [Candidatus Eisenbacteria bacterium]|nr:hypothetical protein [Candidatus Eisenbacteria bacterium]
MPACWIITLILLALRGPAPAAGLEAVDTPNDHGGTVALSWAPPAEGQPDRYLVLRAAVEAGPFDTVAVLPASALRYSDSDSLTDGQPYYYRLIAQAERWSREYPSAQAIPLAQWFHRGKAVVLVFSVGFAAIMLLMIHHARRGMQLYVRPIAGIGAVDEAIGRATEMGKPILFVPGIGEASEVATIAAFTVLGRVAKRTAEYGTRLIVPNTYATVMIIAQEVVKASCINAGRPEAYQERDVFYVTSEQFPFTAAVNGLMLRERPATNFYLGKFYAESLILAETGFQAGSIQIAGTDELTQIPFFVAACDYTLMGEELYAASAYLSNDPLQLGTLKAQDIAKLIVVALVIAGTLAVTLGSDSVVRLLDIVQ